jgi:SAM-dependent methyltransferase
MHRLHKTESPICNVCGSARVADKGPLPGLTPDVFGGQRMSVRLNAGRLYHCTRCDFSFRYPYADQNLLLKLYEDLPSSVWESSEVRPVWAEIAECCERYAKRMNILDIGCFTGNFLEWLPQAWKKAGIEPSSAARKMAAGRGINIAANAIGEPVSLSTRPSIITLIDVIEHLEKPVDGLRYARDLLVDDGILIIFTGAADSLPWRLFGVDYWYSALPEHISFFTRRCFEFLACELNMRLIHCRHMSSVEANATRSSLNFSRLGLYTAVQRLRRRGWSENSLASVPLLRRAATWSHVPWWQEAVDHQLVVLAR